MNNSYDIAAHKALLDAVYTYSIDRQGTIALPPGSPSSYLDNDTFRKHLLVRDAVVHSHLQAYAANNNCVILLGKPGTGKTTLLDDFLLPLTSAGRMVVKIDILRDIEHYHALPILSESNVTLPQQPSLSFPSPPLHSTLGDLLHHLLTREIRRHIHDVYNPNHPQHSIHNAAIHLFHYHASRSKDSPPVLELSRTAYEPFVAMANAAAAARVTRSDTAAWLTTELSSASSEVYRTFHDFVNSLQLRDLLLCAALTNAPDPSVSRPHIDSVMLVLDNCDSVVQPSLAADLFDWVRTCVVPWRSIAKFIVSFRSETFDYIQHRQVPYLDHTAIWFDEIDIDALHRQASISDTNLIRTTVLDDVEGDDSLSYRHELTSSVLSKRHDFAKSLVDRDTSKRQTYASSQMEFLSSLQHDPLFSRCATAFSNSNNRMAMLMLLEFSRVSSDVLPLEEWCKDKSDKIELCKRVHAESLFYSWLSNCLGKHPCGYGIDNYCPSSGVYHPNVRTEDWHTCKLRHFVLASIYNLSAQGIAPLQGAATSDVIRNLLLLGFDEKTVAREILALMADKITHTRDGKPVPHDLANYSRVHRVDGIPIDAFIRRNYLLPVGRQSVPVADGAISLPSRLLLSDRAKQIVLHSSVKFHFVLGLARRHCPPLYRDDHLLNSLLASPLDDTFLMESISILQDMCLFHTQVLSNMGKALVPSVGNRWIEHVRSLYGVPPNGFVSHFGQGNAFVVERILHAAKGYLGRIGVAFASSSTGAGGLIPGLSKPVSQWQHSLDNLLISWQKAVDEVVIPSPGVAIDRRLFRVQGN